MHKTQGRGSGTGPYQRTDPAKPTCIVLPFVDEKQPFREVIAVDGRAFFAAFGRVCPCCGGDGLIGNGSRGRTYRTEPIGRGRAVPETRAYRVICTHCGHSHTVLPPALGPHKRYTLWVIESAARAREAGESLARISTSLGGVSIERIWTWHTHVMERLDAARRAVEDIVRHDPGFARPAALPGMDVFAYLRSLLGIVPAIGVLVAINCLVSAHLPLVEALLVHPPSSSGRLRTPCRTALAGGAGFG